MYILKDINLENDEILESLPVCLREGKNEEIYCMGVLAKRIISQGTNEGLPYYQFVYFYGNSPINFNKRDYAKMQNDYSFDVDLEMIADFRYRYSEFSSTPGLSTERQVMQVPKNL